jgi:MFS family permease
VNRDKASRRSGSPFGFTFIAPLVLGSVLNPINSTMLATALVPIAESLGSDIAATGWLIAALYLTTAVAQPTLGRMVDLLGARRVFLASLGLVAAAACAANSPQPLPDWWRCASFSASAPRAPIRRRCGFCASAARRPDRSRRALYSAL